MYPGGSWSRGFALLPRFWTIKQFITIFSRCSWTEINTFNCSIKMSVYYIASLKIKYFIAQNLGNKAKPRDHDPPGYFRSQKYPGYEVAVV